MTAARVMAGALAWLLAACGSRAPAAEPAPPPAAAADAAPANSHFMPIRAAADVRAFDATGRLLAPPNARAEITMPLQATVLAVRVSPGQRVEAKQVVASVAVPEAARARGQLEGAKLRSEGYAARVAQLEQLRTEGLARGADLADARARLHDAQSAAREAQAVLESVKSAGLELHGDRYDVRTPIAGVVVEVDAPLGAVRGPSDRPICTIAGGDARRVEARFAFALPDDPSVRYELEVPGHAAIALSPVSQAPEVRESDATRLAWFDAQSPPGLPPGSVIHVHLHLPPDAFVVPSAALSQAASTTLRTRRAGPVPVQLLAALGSEALVRGALQPDDLVEVGSEAAE